MEVQPDTSHLPPEALLPDAPIHHLLNLRHNPLVADMTNEQLAAFVAKLRTLATSAPTMSAKLASDSEKIKPKRKPNQRQALLDSI